MFVFYNNKDFRLDVRADFNEAVFELELPEKGLYNLKYFSDVDKQITEFINNLSEQKDKHMLIKVILDHRKLKKSRFVNRQEFLQTISSLVLYALTTKEETGREYRLGRPTFLEYVGGVSSPSLMKAINNKTKFDAFNIIIIDKKRKDKIIRSVF